MSETEKKAATPRGRKKKAVKEEHIASIGPDSSPELVHEELGRAADNVSVKEAPTEAGDWGTFSDRGAPTTDPLIEEQRNAIETIAAARAKIDSAPSLMGEDEQNEKPAGILEGEFTIQGEGKEKPTGQMTLGGTMAPVATITYKPMAIPVEITLANNKAKLNTTQEGLDNMAAMIRMDLKAKVIPKVKILPKAVILEGDFDRAVDTFCDIIHGKVPVLKVHVGDDEAD
jgi:hypothetical protein